MFTYHVSICRCIVSYHIILSSRRFPREDECRKHAPNLVVKVCHPSRKKKDPSTFDFLNTKNIHKIDIILSTATFNWEYKCSGFNSAFAFHRSVFDESHLFNKSSSAEVSFAMKIMSTRRWCVTATPCTGSVSELARQSKFLGDAGLPGRDFDMDNSKEKFYWLLDVLKPIMVRHTKSQRINGSEALALPPSTTTTTLVTMSPTEMASMELKINEQTVAKYRRSSGAMAFPLSRALGLLSGFGCESKLVILRNDLNSLRRKEPSARVVIFTQSRHTHEKIINAARLDGFDVLQFSGSTGAKQRDTSIRKFQNSNSTRPSVFVITMQSGSVGMTLTAASRVYLMEPCLDPAVEVQAAGRIHRLGQTKSVQVIRYAFRNSPEENIVRLHKEIVAGRVSITDGLVPPAAIKILARGL